MLQAVSHVPCGSQITGPCSQYPGPPDFTLPPPFQATALVALVSVMIVDPGTDFLDSNWWHDPATAQNRLSCTRDGSCVC